MILFEPHMGTLVRKDAAGKLHQAFLDKYRIDAKSAIVDVRVVGDLGVAHGTWVETVTPNAEDMASGVDFFIRRDGRWRIVHSRLTMLKPSWAWRYLTPRNLTSVSKRRKFV